MTSDVMQFEGLGASPTRGGTRFTVRSLSAERMWVSFFDAKGNSELSRVELPRESPDTFSAVVPGVAPGARYGLRADGAYAPERGLWFDPAKLLMDPYAVAIDRPYRFDPRLALRREAAQDTAALMPKAVVTALPPPLSLAAPLFDPARPVYELQVRAFSMLHPKVPKQKRGTIAALAEPAVVEHLQRLGVGAVELMPVTAWIDERHLGPLGLTNAWGYNPVSFMALDPRLAPGGLAELRETVAALHAAGICTVLDLVFNHTGEGDTQGPTLSLRGLDNPSYYRHAPDGRLINDTGTGNTIACDTPIVERLVLDTLRHFVLQAGVDGFRFDLATILGRRASGFDGQAPLLESIRNDPVVGSRVLLAEPWDIGPGGYQLGRFGAPFLEWNDRYRDDTRRFWRGDSGTVGALATRLAGSSDVFGGVTRSLNFVAAHDGMTLADTVAYERKHNEANGEGNRDGHGDNHSWNNGAEGPTRSAAILERRRRDIQALLATLFASRGAIMLAAGDEGGRSQGGNNNAYAQDNEAFWLAWRGRDRALEDYAARLAAWRAGVPFFRGGAALTGAPSGGAPFPDVEWLGAHGGPLSVAEWQEPDRRRLAMVADRDIGAAPAERRRIAVCFNADRRKTCFALPARPGWRWVVAVEPLPGEVRMALAGPVVPSRSVICLEERLV